MSATYDIRQRQARRWFLINNEATERAARRWLAQYGQGHLRIVHRTAAGERVVFDNTKEHQATAPRERGVGSC